MHHTHGPLRSHGVLCICMYACVSRLPFCVFFFATCQPTRLNLCCSPYTSPMEMWPTCIRRFWGIPCVLGDNGIKCSHVAWKAAVWLVAALYTTHTCVCVRSACWPPSLQSKFCECTGCRAGLTFGCIWYYSCSARGVSVNVSPAYVLRLEGGPYAVDERPV